MSLRELTAEEMLLVTGGEGEGNGGDSPGTGSNGGGDGNGNGATGSESSGSGTDDSGYSFDEDENGYAAAGFLGAMGKAARDLGLSALGSALYDGAKSAFANGPYGPLNPSPSLGPKPDNTPYGSTPMDGYGVDGTPAGSGGTAMQ